MPGDRHLEALIAGFRAATSAYLRLECCPRWRWRRRRRLELELAAAAGVADRARFELGAPDDAPGLLEVLAQVSPIGTDALEGLEALELGATLPPLHTFEAGAPLAPTGPPPAWLLELADAPATMDEHGPAVD